MAMHIHLSRLGLFVIALLTIAQAAHAQPVVRSAGNGNLSVDLYGCSVLFDRTDRILSTGRDCSSDQIRRAREAVSTHRREQGAGDGVRGPSWWITTGVPNDNLALRDRPSMAGRYLIQRIGNGETMRNLGCSDQRDERWCEVEYRGERGWVRERYLRPDGGYDDGYGPGPDITEWWVTAGVRYDDLSLRDRPSTSGRDLVRRIGNGESMRNLGCSFERGEDWCEVEYRGQRGWVQQRYLRPDDDRPGFDEPAWRPAEGFGDRREAERAVRSLYRGLLGRDVDRESLDAAVTEVQRGRLEDQVRSMVRSREFAQSTSGMTSREILDRLYEGLLGREPDPSAVRGFLPQIERGRIGEVALEIVSSPEFRDRR